MFVVMRFGYRYYANAYLLLVKSAFIFVLRILYRAPDYLATFYYPSGSEYNSTRVIACCALDNYNTYIYVLSTSPNILLQESVCDLSVT